MNENQKGIHPCVDQPCARRGSYGTEHNRCRKHYGQYRRRLDSVLKWQQTHRTQQTKNVKASRARRTPEQKRGHYLRTKYGITPQDWNAMNDFQGGGCAICGYRPKRRRLAVDHNHKTGEVRGLLCRLCNYGIGWWRENRTSLLRAAVYLTRPPRAELLAGRPFDLAMTTAIMDTIPKLMEKPLERYARNPEGGTEG